MPHVENLRIYPIKGLDAVDVAAANITEAGTLRGDRAYAMVDPGTDTDTAAFDTVGDTLNGKEIDRLHEITSAFDPETASLTLSTAAETAQFDLSTERAAASEWLSEFIGRPIELRTREPPGFPDRTSLGPSVISTATLEEVASWFGGMTVDGARRRLRANIEIGGVPAFWEDRFLDDTSAFEVDGVRFEDAEPCARCVVPSRDPDTGEPIERFAQRFAERREATLPEWAPKTAFDHFFAVMIITRVPDQSRGGTIRVGSKVQEDNLRT